MALPERGTAPIKCAKTKCKFRGYETDLKQVPNPEIGGTKSVCPVCGHDSYMFMTTKEVESWKRNAGTKVEVHMKLGLHPEMTIAQLIHQLLNDFAKTGATAADFEIPGTDGRKQFVLHFDISLRALDISKERTH